MIEFFETQGSFMAKYSTSDRIIQTMKPLLDAVVDFYTNMEPELRAEIKTQYGSNGPMQHWRYLQKAIHDKYKEFAPVGFEAWWADNSKQYNDDSLEMLDLISMEVINRVRKMLVETDNDLPLKIKMDLNNRMFKQNEARKAEGKPLLDYWDVFTLSDCEILANEGRLWTDGLKSVLTRPEQEGRKGGNKAAKIKWLTDLGKIRNNLKRSSYSVKQSDFEYVSTVYRWIFGQDFREAAEDMQGVAVIPGIGRRQLRNTYSR